MIVTASTTLYIGTSLPQRNSLASTHLSLFASCYNAKRSQHSPPGCMLRSFVCRKLGIQNLVCMGGFKNRRQEIAWEGETLELDETFFERGTLYEIECETVGMEVWGAWLMLHSGHDLDL